MRKKKNIIYLTGGFIIVITGLISFAIIPLFLEITGRSEDLKLKKRNLDYLSERAREPDQEIGDLREILDKIDDMFINPRRPVDQIIFLERLASENNLDMDLSIAGPRESEDEMWSYLNFAISIRGEINDLYRFIEEIQNKNWFASINRLNIRKMTERDVREGSSDFFNEAVIADMSLNIYFRE